MIAISLFLCVVAVCWTVRDIVIRVYAGREHPNLPEQLTVDAKELRRYMDRVDVLAMKAGLDGAPTGKN